MNETSRTPLFYSLQYHLEADVTAGIGKQEHFVDLAAHYDAFTVHFIQDLQDGNNSWVVVTEGDNPLAPSPRVRE